MKKQLRSAALLALDIILVNLSLLMAYLLTFDGKYSNIPPEMRNWEVIVNTAIIATIIKVATYLTVKLYSSVWKYAGIYEVVTTVAASFMSNTIVLAYIFLTRLPVPRRIFIITFFIDIVFIGGSRLSYRVFRRIIRGEAIRFKDYKRIMIIGGGDAGAIIVRELLIHSALNSKPVVIMDDDPLKQRRKINGVPILGTTRDIETVAEKMKIDEIIIAIPSASKKLIGEIFDHCSKTSCKIKILPSLSQLIDETVTIQKVRDVAIEDLLGREPVKLDQEKIASVISGQTVLVTGGGGSIGSELCRQIAALAPKQLIILDIYENNAYEIQQELLSTHPSMNLEVVIANVREKKRIEQVFAKYRPAVVFHAAAHKHVPLMEANPAEAIKNNVFGTMNVAECADHYAAERFVLISTDKAVNPTNIMGATKRMAEMIIQGIDKRSKTEFVAVRFGNVLGSNGSVIPLFKKQIAMGGPVKVTHPEINRFFMTIPEAVQLVIQAGAMAQGGEIFVLDMGEPVKILDLAKNLIRLSGFEPDEDIMIEFTGLRPGEKLYEELLMAEEGLKATKNDKIYVAQPVYTDLALLKRELEMLANKVLDQDGDIKAYMEAIVPTYKRAN